MSLLPAACPAVGTRNVVREGNLFQKVGVNFVPFLLSLL